MYKEVREEKKWREGWGKKEGNDGKRKMPCTYMYMEYVLRIASHFINLDGSTWSQWNSHKCMENGGNPFIIWNTL